MMLDSKTEGPLSIIPVLTRACDLCNVQVTDSRHQVIGSFVLSNRGVFCINCWDFRIAETAGVRVIRVYVRTQIVRDPWIFCPLILSPVHSRSVGQPPKWGTSQSPSR